MVGKNMKSRKLHFIKKRWEYNFFVCAIVCIYTILILSFNNGYDSAQYRVDFVYFIIQTCDFFIIQQYLIDCFFKIKSNQQEMMNIIHLKLYKYFYCCELLLLLLLVVLPIVSLYCVCCCSTLLFDTGEV
eukprot:UN01689